MNPFKTLIDSFKNITPEQIQGLSSAVPGIMTAGDAIFGGAGIDKSIKAPSLERDVTGRPVYNQYQFIDANRDFRSGIKGTVGRGALQGAIGGLQAGAAFGNPFTAAIAGGAGLIGGLIGGKVRKKKLLEEANRREDLSAQAVNSFNLSAQNFSQQEEADDYRDAVLRRRRIY